MVTFSRWPERASIEQSDLPPRITAPVISLSLSLVSPRSTVPRFRRPPRTGSVLRPPPSQGQGRHRRQQRNSRRAEGSAVAVLRRPESRAPEPTSSAAEPFQLTPRYSMPRRKAGRLAVLRLPSPLCEYDPLAKTIQTPVHLAGNCLRVVSVAVRVDVVVFPILVGYFL
jgi:hypothetical protein